MSATRNIDSMTNKQGEFQPSVPRDEPMEKGGHKPGVKASPADYAPENKPQVLPPGSAPPEKTYVSNTASEIPSQANNASTLRAHGKESTQTTASSSLGGATSGDVHTGLGKPGVGQSSAEMRHEGGAHRKHKGAGLEGVGASGRETIVDERITANQRALEKEEAASGKRGNKGELGAEEKYPEGAETVASERK